MTAILSVDVVQVNDPQKMKEYSMKFHASAAPHGIKTLYKGKMVKILGGEASHVMEIVFEFPNMEALDTWYNSEEYQALIPLRQEAAVLNIKVLAGLE